MPERLHCPKCGRLVGVRVTGALYKHDRINGCENVDPDYREPMPPIVGERYVLQQQETATGTWDLGGISYAPENVPALFEYLDWWMANAPNSSPVRVIHQIDVLVPLDTLRAISGASVGPDTQTHLKQEIGPSWADSRRE